MTIRVALIFGGESPEHEVSIVSARFVYAQLQEVGYQVTAIGIDVRGGWHRGEHVFGELSDLVGQDFEPDLKQRSTIIGELISNAYDVVFPLIHGLTGEDGNIQGLCELFGIPFVGGDSLCQSLCYDKLSTRYSLTQLGLPQPDFVSLFREQFAGGRYWVIDMVERALAFPLFVKPSRTGSSIGVNKVTSRSDLADALECAFQYDHRVIVENAIVGREIEVAVLGDINPVISAPGEIIPENDFYDFEEKYLKNSTQFEVPAAMSSDQLAQVTEQAKHAWRYLNCHGMARVDFLVSTDAIYLNEVNTIPGFTEISMFPKLLRESGINSHQLMERLVNLAIERQRNDRKREFLSQSDWFKS